MILDDRVGECNETWVTPSVAIAGSSGWFELDSLFAFGFGAFGIAMVVHFSV